ncbi:hypothetical protein [Clostridium sp. YIM B02551]|uniref:hypothetical protein n=1 Tax=Clostridium sp. YIM B02551 TaxID=2910679 RepID=UPI001EEBF0DF|nr:hypothetical protein [Clostridium sp. YIM B02551]
MEEILKEAVKLLFDNKVKNIEEAIKMATEVINTKLSIDETIQGLREMEKETERLNAMVNNYGCQAGSRLKKDLKVLRNAIAYIENSYEDERGDLDTSKALFILEQKAGYNNAYYVNKLYEELREYEESLINGDRENQLEEILDIIQMSVTNLAEVLQPTETELLQAIEKHNEKLLVDRHYNAKQVALIFNFLGV